MSTSKEIQEVFQAEIEQKSRQVLNKEGIKPFLEGLDGFQIERLIDLHPEIGDLFQEILCQDRELQQEGGEC